MYGWSQAGALGDQAASSYMVTSSKHLTREKRIQECVQA